MLKALVKSRFQALFAGMAQGGAKKNKKPRSRGVLVLLAVLFVYVFGIFAIMSGTVFYAILPMLYETGNLWLYFSYASIAAFAVMIFAGTVMTKTQIYEAKDNEFLLSMPVKPSYILLSRSIVLLIYNFVYELAIFLPAALVWFISFGFDLLTLLYILLVMAALMLFAFAVSGILGFLLAKATARVKNKSIVTMALVAVFFVFYFYFVGNSSALVETFIMNSAEYAQSLSGIAPIYFIGSALAEGNVAHLLLSLVILLAPFAAVWAVLSKTLVKTATFNKGHAKARYRARELEVSSKKSAVFGMEFLRFYKTTAWFINGGLGAVLIAAAGVLVLWKRETVLLALGNIGAEGAAPWIFIGALMFMTAMGLITPCSVSLEGKNLWLSHSLPIKAESLLKTKIAVQVVFNGAAILLASVCAIIALTPSVAEMAFMVVIPQLFGLFIAILGLVMNLRHPNMAWTNETQAVKQGLAVLFTMLIGWGSVLPVAAVAVLTSVFKIPVIGMAAVTSVIAAVCFLLWKWTMTSGVKKYENL